MLTRYLPVREVVKGTVREHLSSAVRHKTGNAVVKVTLIALGYKRINVDGGWT